MSAKKIMTAQERRKRNHDEMVEDVLTIAREMMQADGVAALSFNAIAKRLGIKPPSLYTYFDSKHAIYDALFRRGFEEFGRQMETRPDRDSDFAVNMTSALVTYMRFGLENPDLFQLMFQRPVPGFEPSEESMAVSLNLLRTYREELGEIIQSDTVNPDLSLEHASDLTIALMHGLTELQLANDPDMPVGEGRFGVLVEAAVQIFVKAWKEKPS